MFVDRVMTVEGEPRDMGPGKIVTEHDVAADAWYLDTKRMPAGLSIEAGQADLLLSAYLGVDFATRGESNYRLLDAEVTFHRGLARPGDVLRYEIQIERFVRQGDTIIFFFSFDGFVGDEPLMSMRRGCAGFFTPRQLAEGRGIVPGEEDRTPQPGKIPADWQTPVPMAREAYDENQLNRLRAGDLAGCFGKAFGGSLFGIRLRSPADD